MNEDRWHFPRTEFAEKVYNKLVNGATQGVRIFGPRRSGKTQFLIRDLISLAKSKGHRVAYVDFWETSDSPLRNMIDGFENALRPRTALECMGRNFRHMAVMLSLRGPFGELKLDFSNLMEKPPQEVHKLFSECCERLARDSKPAFLVLDEFQELARRETSEQLVKILRGAFNKHRGGLVAVFAGSSEAGMEEMFSQRNAPFFQFSEKIGLPALGEDFVDHQLKALFDFARIEFDRSAALGVFNWYEHNPAFFQRFLQEIPNYSGKSENEVTKAVQDILADEYGFVSQWRKLAKNQKIAVLMLISRFKDKDEHISVLTKGNLLSESAYRAALDEMHKLHIVDKVDGKWIVADPLFKSWVDSRPPEDIRAFFQ